MARNTRLQLLSIGELSAATGCSAGTIRYYERLGLLNAPPRTGSGRRVYTARHLEQLRFVLKARAFGFSLDRIRALVRLADRADRPRPEAWAIAEAHLSELESRIAELQQLVQRLDALIEQAPPDSKGVSPILAFLTGKDRAA